MKRQSSSCESSSTKRLRLEYEIFSTSIQDIEKMFTEEILTSPTNNSRHPYNPDSCQYLDTVVPSTDFKYDCINMAFLVEEKKNHHNKFIPSHGGSDINGRNEGGPKFSPPEKSMYLDLDNNEEYDELQNYKPSINQDLLMIDRLISFNH
ncbi:hypothetical protein K6H09_003053 [Candida tropicalis]